MSIEVVWFIRVSGSTRAVLPAPGSVTFLTRVKAFIDGLIAYGFGEVGDYKICATSARQKGYLYADGSAVSRSSYPQLFAQIGTTYGVGDGATTFNLPDLRGATITPAATVPETVVSGGSVVPATGGVPDPAPAPTGTGGTGGNRATGGRPPRPGENYV